MKLSMTAVLTFDLDKENDNTRWVDAIAKEMENIKHHSTYC